mmetsp:Transcript_18655/g.25993  ORF Transcript_18655/g.25993 Transcript_18655/m.25993 type:complete len:281 (-) Transcript_18655:50-892(-)|eukprot:CAMPEP_0184504078 /NCGR_PEP_ID=MMETSP0113_2-20130426/52271_1 /TAXON_ID=91329 /ORGANISM="Norrisiella sphaerica, Strain BC52" /LENGTH=280 /DNA_ID=CAMNT_0026893693 /DNA_START=27 /DNA_END=869 /DNA_ORIENTATION=+
MVSRAIGTSAVFGRLRSSAAKCIRNAMRISASTNSAFLTNSGKFFLFAGSVAVSGHVALARPNVAETGRDAQRREMRKYCDDLLAEDRLSELFDGACELERVFGVREALEHYQYGASRGDPKSMVAYALLQDSREQSFWAYEAVKKGELIAQMLIPGLCDRKEPRHLIKDLKILNSRSNLDTPSKLMKVYTLVTLCSQSNLSRVERDAMMKEAFDIMNSLKKDHDGIGSYGRLTLVESKLTLPLYMRYQKLFDLSNPEVISRCAPSLQEIRAGTNSITEA